MKYRILALDIDGTLIRSDGTMSDATREALKKAHKSGIHVILCTGRRFRIALPYTLELGFDVPIITNGGALIKDAYTEETLYINRIESDLCQRLVKFLSSQSDSILIYLDSPMKDKTDFLATPPTGKAEGYRNCLRRNADLYCLIENGVLPKGMNPIQICVVEELDVLAGIAAKLDELFGVDVSSHVMGSVPVIGDVLEVFAPETSKWTALCKWASMLEIGSGEIVAVGDEMNDLEMIEKAGLGVAMGNAVPAVKEKATMILPDNDNDGLVTIVDHLLETMEERDGICGHLSYLSSSVRSLEGE